MDQYSRHIFRNLKEGYENDKNCVEVSKKIYSEKKEKNYKIFERMFIGMPFMHSESLEDQEIGVEYFENLLNDCDCKEIIKMNLFYTKEHRDVIKKFGRFPHRNNILGRNGSNDEDEFLLNDPPVWARIIT